MIRKIKIVLLQPRFIGLFIKEKVWKSLLMIFIASAISIIPGAITEINNKEISSDFRTELVTNMQNANVSDAKIEDGVLSYVDQYIISYTYFNVIIGGELNLDNLYTYNFIFEEKDLTLYVSNIAVYSVSYEDLNITNLDFSLVKTTSLTESNKLIYIFNQLYIANKNVVSFYNITAYYIEVLFTIFTGALIMTCFTMIFNSSGNIMPFKYRYKTCLNCQYIYIFSILLSFLYYNVYIQILGNFLMALYVVIATSSIRMEKGRIK
ncbi:MAG: hypothetical protein R3Y05_03590 [bacterium]